MSQVFCFYQSAGGYKKTPRKLYVGQRVRMGVGCTAVRWVEKTSNPFSTAVSFRGQTSQFPSSLSPRRGCGLKRNAKTTTTPPCGYARKHLRTVPRNISEDCRSHQRFSEGRSNPPIHIVLHKCCTKVLTVVLLCLYVL